MSQAEKLFAETFLSSNSRFAVIYSFRQIAELGLPAATLGIYDQYLQFTEELFNDPQHDSLFIDKQKAFETLGGVEALGSKMAQDQITKYKASVDAASLIFAHSVIDNAVLNYCRCSALTAPDDWEKFIEEKKVSIEEIKDLTVNEILNNKINEYIDSLDRESLLYKADRLLSICQPPAKFSPIHNYSYDRMRILQLDKMRHEIVHGSSSVPILPSGVDDIWFLQQTSNYYMGLINSKYKFKIDPLHMPQALQINSPTKPSRRSSKEARP